MLRPLARTLASRRHRRHRLLASLALALACDSAEIPIGAERCQSPGVDPFQLTALGPTDRSHWLQPWRAYLETLPAGRLRRGIGLGIGGDYFDKAKVPLLAQSGIARSIMVLQWSGQDWDDPDRLQSDGREELRARLRTLKAAGVRPGLLLYGHEGTPCPFKAWKLRLTKAAAKGARAVEVDRAQAAQIVPHRTGFNGLTGYRASEVLITAVDANGVATLAKPLPKELPAGMVDVTTVRYRPFSRPTLPDGSRNPIFEETLDGWIRWVAAVAREAKDALGSTELDLELWNEIVTGADFLDISNYYDQPDELAPSGPYEIPRAILERTVRALRDPALGLGGLAIGDGFANTEWAFASSLEPVGLTAMNRHVSSPGLQLPMDAATLGTEARPLNHKGQSVGVRGADGRWQEPFIPRYDAFFPELPLTAVLPYKGRRPGQLIRDLAPITTVDANGVAHGRRAARPGGPTQLWITALSTRPKSTSEAPAGLARADVWHFQTKVALRSIAAYLGKGADAIYFYAPSGDLQLVDLADPTGGEVLRALKRFRAAFDGPDSIARPRALRLVAIKGCGGKQFEGDGTPARPDLVNRDAVAFFPFQVDDRRFVVATYVMTRDLMALQRPGLGTADVARYDMPPESYDLVVEGVAGNALVELTDPVEGATVEATVKLRAPNRLVISAPLTDSVRLLTIAEP